MRGLGKICGRGWQVYPESIAFRPATDVNQDIARGISALPKQFLPFPSEFSLTLRPASIDAVGQRIDTAMRGLQATWQYNHALATGMGYVMNNVWSRAFRRKHNSAGGSDHAGRTQESEVEEAALAFKIQARYAHGSTDTVVVTIRWLKGNDSVLFESFCGMVKRKLEVDS